MTPDQKTTAGMLKRLALGMLLGFIFGATLGWSLGVATQNLWLGLVIGSLAGILMGAGLGWTGRISLLENREQTGRTALFYASGLILPCFSPSFYYHASRRRLRHAILFLLAFGMILASVKMLSIAGAMQTVRRSVSDLFASTRVPTITISEGYATIESLKPVVLADSQEMLIVLDGTGEYDGEELRDGRRSGGLIVSRDQVTLLNEQGETLVIPFAGLKRWPWLDLRIDANVAAKVVLLVQLILFAGWAIWFTWIRLAYLALLAAIIRGLSTLSGRQIDFSTLLITGIFATVPATYLSHLFERLGGALYGRFTLFLMLVWATGLVAAIMPRKVGDLLRGQRPLRPWRALAGLPLLLAMALELIYRWPEGTLILAVVAAATVILFLMITLLPRFGVAPAFRAGREVAQRA